MFTVLKLQQLRTCELLIFRRKVCSCEKDRINEINPFSYSPLSNTGKKDSIFLSVTHRKDRDSFYFKGRIPNFSHLFSDKVDLGTFW